MSSFATIITLSSIFLAFTIINNIKVYVFCLAIKKTCNKDSNKPSLSLPPKNLSHLSNEFDSFNYLISIIPRKYNWKYHDINQLQTLKEFTDKALFLFFFWTPGLSNKIDDLDHLIQSTKNNFNTLLFLNQDQSKINSQQLMQVSQRIVIFVQRKPILVVPTLIRGITSHIKLKIT